MLKLMKPLSRPQTNLKNDENPRQERGQEAVRRCVCKQLHAHHLYSKTRLQSQCLLLGKAV
jgi:hypothetical protein